MPAFSYASSVRAVMHSNFIAVTLVTSKVLPTAASNILAISYFHGPSSTGLNSAGLAVHMYITPLCVFLTQLAFSCAVLVRAVMYSTLVIVTTVTNKVWPVAALNSLAASLSTDLNSAGSAVHTASATCAFVCCVHSSVQWCCTAIMQHLFACCHNNATLIVTMKSVLAKSCSEQPGCVLSFA